MGLREDNPKEPLDFIGCIMLADSMREDDVSDEVIVEALANESYEWRMWVTRYKYELNITYPLTTNADRSTL